MSKSSKNKPGKDEIEANINEHLEKIRVFTDGILETKTTPSEFMAYMMANVAHVAELMWMVNIEMNKGIDLTTELIKSAYTQFEENTKGESNEETK